jgi:hypothetical protein
LLVHRQRRRADQFRQFARRGAAHQVHFEIALLRMHEAKCPGGIAAAAGADRGRAERVALDSCRRVQLRGGNGARQLRQAAAQQQPYSHDRTDEQDGNQRDQACGERSALAHAYGGSRIRRGRIVP